MTVEIDRILPTGGILNLRDYGGYTALSGARLRRNVLFRSAAHSNATVDDLMVVDALGLRAVIDMRNDSERAAQPCRRGPAFDGRVYFNPDSALTQAPHLAAIEQPSTAASVHRRMVRYYRESPFREAQIASLGLYFRALADAQGPSLVHCAAGKDRTGVAVALLHAMMGVSMDDIIQDYLLTNQAGSIPERANAFAYSVRHHLGADLSQDALEATLSVAPEYIEAAFASIAERCGTVGAYLETVLQVGPDTRNAIAAYLLD